MSAIAGFVNLNVEEAEEFVLRAMLARLPGPGGGGATIDCRGCVALGTRHDGPQMRTGENGARSVRAVCAGRRIGAATVTALYKRYGMNLAAHADGAFVFALCDDEKRKLLLARDRAGIKPLFYFRTGNVFAFAQSLPALRTHPEANGELDKQKLWDFLSLQYIVSGTVYRDLKVLAPGSLLELDLDTREVRIRRYWTPDYGHKLNISYVDACRELEKRLRAAVVKRLNAPDPPGALLSGGIDSAIVAGLSAEMLDAPLRCYTAAFRERAYDEREEAVRHGAWIRKFSRHGLEHRIIGVGPDCLEFLPRLLGNCGQPFADASLLPTVRLCAAAGEETATVLGGDGADELFRGYDRYRAMNYLAKLDFLPEFLRALFFALPGKLLPDGGGERTVPARAKRLFVAAAKSGAARYLSIVSHTDERLKRRFCGDFFAGVHPTPERFAALREERLPAATGPDHAADRAGWPEFDFHTYLPGDLLPKADMASSAAALNLRSPFLDRGIIEFAAALPEEFKEKAGRNKRILRDTFTKYLPPDTERQRKRGFGVPLALWFRNEWKELFAERLLTGSEAVKRGLFTQTGLERLLAEHQAGCDRSYALYSILVLEIFLNGGEA